MNYEQKAAEKIKQFVSENFEVPINTVCMNKVKQAEKILLEIKILEEERKRVLQSTEPCESGLFSSYVNVEGVFYPCSFFEGQFNTTIGLDLVNGRCPDGITRDISFKDSWESGNYIQNWRNMLEGSNRSCPIYDV